MEVAQSPPLCDWLGEPLGFGERRSLTSAAPAGPSRPRLLFLFALPFRQKLQLGSALLFLPPALNLSSLLLCCSCIKFPDSEPVTSGERTSEFQCPHQERMLSGIPSSLSHVHPHSNRRHTQPSLPQVPPQAWRSLWNGPTACMQTFVHPLSVERPVVLIARHR